MCLETLASPHTARVTAVAESQSKGGGRDLALLLTGSLSIDSCDAFRTYLQQFDVKLTTVLFRASLLHWSVWHRVTDCTLFLVSHLLPSFLDALDSAGNTVLHLAVQTNDSTVYAIIRAAIICAVCACIYNIYNLRCVCMSLSFALCVHVSITCAVCGCIYNLRCVWMYL